MNTLEKIVVWSDYDWCFFDALDDYLFFKSDDYFIVNLPDFMEFPTFEFIALVANGEYNEF